MKTHFLLGLLAVLFTSHAAEQPPGAEIVIGRKETFQSTVLGEERSLQIFTPSNYATAKASYPTLPVLYLLDGDDHFAHVTGLVDYLARKHRIPPMIVVAVGNTNRNRDFSPSASSNYNGKPVPIKHGGGATKFLHFLRDELIPHIEKNYRTAPFRILGGYSFGGLFATKVLQDSPETFQAYITVSPSLWWDDELLLKTTGPIGRERQYVFLSVGNEGGTHRKAIDRYVAQLKERAAPGFRWAFKAYDEETHASVPHVTLYDGLQFIFAGWDLPYRDENSEPLVVADAVRHYAGLSERYGFEIKMPFVAFRIVAEDLAERERWDDAIASYREAAVQLPKSPDPHNGLGSVYSRRGDKDAAIAAHQKALQISPTNSTAKKALERLAAEPEPAKATTQ